VLVVGAASLALWGAFVMAQTVRHRDYFVDPQETGAELHEKPSNNLAIASLGLLFLSLTAVILLAKVLSPPLSRAIDAAGLPKALVGVVIAAIVLLPEGIAAVKSALADRLQNSVNLAVGSAIASIGLTIPTVAVLSVALGLPLHLGVADTGVTLLALTLFVSTLTLGTGRTNALFGVVHLVIFAVFLLVSAVP
jgi:Ca2+:H+ antiporter